MSLNPSARRIARYSSALARSALTSRLRATAAPAGAARPGRPWHRPRWTAWLRCRSTCPTSGSDAPARSISVASACRSRCAPRRSQTRPVAGPAHDSPDRLRRQLPVRPPHRHEHRPRLAPGTAAGQPASQSLPGQDRKREPLGAAALARDREFPGPPVDVSKLQAGGLRAAQAEPGQQRQDRVITQADCRLPLAAGQQPLDLGRRQAARQPGQPPRRDGRDRPGQRDRRPPGRVREPQERPQRGHHRLRRPAVAVLAVIHHERGHLARVQSAHRSRPADRGQEVLRLLGIAPHRYRRKAPLPVQPRAELRQQHRAVIARCTRRASVPLHDHLPVCRNH